MIDTIHYMYSDLYLYNIVVCSLYLCNIRFLSKIHNIDKQNVREILVIFVSIFLSVKRLSLLMIIFYEIKKKKLIIQWVLSILVFSTYLHIINFWETKKIPIDSHNVNFVLPILRTLIKFTFRKIETIQNTFSLYIY